MNTWRDINEVNLYYLKYNIIPSLIAFGLTYSYYNQIILNCSLNEYIKNVLSLFNVIGINIDEEKKLVDNILFNKYKLLIINVDKIEIININKQID